MPAHPSTPDDRSDTSRPPVSAGAPAGDADRALIDRLSDEYLAEYARLSPIMASYLGVAGHDDRLDDFTPDGLAEKHALVTRTLHAVPAPASPDSPAGIAYEVLTERLGVARDLYESGWAQASLNVIDSPVQNVRMVFDLMPHESDEDVATIARRMAAVPRALRDYRTSLLAAADSGRVVALRQIDRCAEQCDTYSGRTAPDGFFRGLARSLGADQDRGSALSADLQRAADAADAAYGELGDFLRAELAPRAPRADAVGRERYALASREFLGATIDLEETYAWGWHEFLELERELRAVAEEIAPGQGPAGAAAILDEDPTYQVRGQDGLQAWMQDLSDRVLADVGAHHVTVAPPLRDLRCRIAPPGGPVGAYYTGPSDDLSRPGAMWWSVEQGREVFSTWREATVVYHEGVPGHHLQIGTAVCQRESLNDFQRLAADCSGYVEGWALYAERLMRELGYFDTPGTLLGFLDSQLFRAARVVVDIGMHLELPIPAGTGFHEGERWNGELGLEFLLTRTISDPAHCRDEIDRYLGWAGQAPAYKVGERIWLAGREAARARHGAAFDLRSFHDRALRLGGMGLDPLAGRLAAL
ncbi:DUF885 domain-containing protein [Nakamurella flava]|uniref:DUF885 domain-containing protein n=1 Tax=Nakamurella flava TaxID=2576308 RepID=A0A4V6Y6N3_9ACTN|nr:DUF885 domain-containing protein [Nakamurella flava]TKV56105.1 DUF885 domain-containing protein [Nakamurella flava]